MTMRRGWHFAALAPLTTLMLFALSPSSSAQVSVEPDAEKRVAAVDLTLYPPTDPIPKSGTVRVDAWGGEPILIQEYGAKRYVRLDSDLTADGRYGPFVMPTGKVLFGVNARGLTNVYCGDFRHPGIGFRVWCFIDQNSDGTFDQQARGDSPTSSTLHVPMVWYIKPLPSQPRYTPIPATEGMREKLGIYARWVTEEKITIGIASGAGEANESYLENLRLEAPFINGVATVQVLGADVEFRRQQGRMVSYVIKSPMRADSFSLGTPAPMIGGPK